MRDWALKMSSIWFELEVVSMYRKIGKLNLETRTWSCIEWISSYSRLSIETSLKALKVNCYICYIYKSAAGRLRLRVRVKDNVSGDDECWVVRKIQVRCKTTSILSTMRRKPILNSHSCSNSNGNSNFSTGRWNPICLLQTHKKLGSTPIKKH